MSTCSLWYLTGAAIVGLLVGANCGFLALALFARPGETRRPDQEWSDDG
jgi:hypothetical protein